MAHGGAGGDAEGGAIDSFGATVILTSALLDRNEALGGRGGRGGAGGGAGGAGGTARGGAIAIFSFGSFTGTAVVVDSVIDRNRALGGNGGKGGMGGVSGDGGDALGGGIFLSPGSVLELSSTEVTRNRADAGKGGESEFKGDDGEGLGGGLFISEGALAWAVDSVIEGNFASDDDDDIFGFLDEL